jgi:hypothetical protein
MTSRIITAVRGNLIASLALFVAMGGTSLAASHYVISSTKQINPKVIKKLKGNSGPRGLAGSQGLQGSQGPQGPVGTVNTANFFNKTESDGRYLGKGEQAADSAKLGGVAASGYTTGEGTQGGNWIEMLNAQEEPNFLSVPGIGELALECGTVTKATAVQLTQHAGSPVFLTWGSYPKEQPTKVETAVLKEDGSTVAQSFGPAESGTGQMIIQATGDLSTSVHTFATITVSASVTGSFCRIQANYTVAQKRF